MVKQKAVWVCRECGHKELKWAGQCLSCKNWNSFDEEMAVEERYVKFESRLLESTKPVLIADVKQEGEQRFLTQFTELDHILGGGVVKGSLALIGGEPGIGKSTLLLQVAKKLADQGLVILYVCGEESAQQIAVRASRLGIESDKLYLLSETVFSQIKRHADQLKPDLLIIDSIQIVYKGDIPSCPGSVTQVREVTMECMHLAKGQGITTFLVGHVTKNGEIAGPRVLEHMVDVVLEFEGDRQGGYRMMRCVKNRFGPTDDVAIFQMTERGLIEVANPSELFLKERVKGSSGSVIIPTMEGTRGILVEIQALIAPSSYATASRRSTGLDPKRLALLLAVLEKKMGYQLHTLDVFVSVAGGMKINEPAVDLGTVLAIASSFCNRPIDERSIVIGEVGLGGEVRSVPRVETRLKEAIHLGFTTCYLSHKNIKGLHPHIQRQIRLCGVDHVEEAIRYLLD